MTAFVFDAQLNDGSRLWPHRAPGSEAGHVNDNRRLRYIMEAVINCIQLTLYAMPGGQLSRL